MRSRAGLRCGGCERRETDRRAGFHLTVLHPGDEDRARSVNDRCLVLRAVGGQRRFDPPARRPRGERRDRASGRGSRAQRRTRSSQPTMERAGAAHRRFWLASLRGSCWSRPELAIGSDIQDRRRWRASPRLPRPCCAQTATARSASSKMAAYGRLQSRIKGVAMKERTKMTASRRRRRRAGRVPTALARR